MEGRGAEEGGPVDVAKVQLATGEQEEAERIKKRKGPPKSESSIRCSEMEKGESTARVLVLM